MQTANLAKASIRLGKALAPAKPAALTFAKVRAELAALGCTIRPNDWNEYAVRLAGDSSPVLIDRGHTRESQQEALQEALLEGRALARRAMPAAPTAKRYRLQSSDFVFAPGLVAWAINGYAFKRDRPNLEKVIGETWGLPLPAVRALLSKAVPFTVEAETVIFEHNA